MFRVNARGPQELGNAVYKLIHENLEIFDASKRATDILDTAVKYKRETPGTNEFLNVNDLLARGVGDCEDLSAALVAYFLFIGIKARPALYQTGPKLWHVTVDVCYKNKWVNMDPSKIKGMK